MREKRAKRGAEYIYQVIYFILATSIGYYIVKDQPYLPRLLGGTTDEIFFFFRSHTTIVPLILIYTI